MLDAGELPDWVMRMMGHEIPQMIHERYYSYIKNYQRDDDKEFMENIYNSSKDKKIKETDEKRASKQSINFPINLTSYMSLTPRMTPKIIRKKLNY
ncbi:MAG: hypothetical protein JW882_15840 [Deltaproteobacteria bacterium]|nr:hypothetical protein [Deltaproteobacteria bacterium]